MTSPKVGLENSWRNTLESAIIKELGPIFVSVFKNALRRYVGETLTADMKTRDKFFMPEDVALLTAAFVQANAIPELLGRLKIRSQHGDIRLADPVDPEKAADTFVNPEKAVRLSPRKAMEYFKALSPRRIKPLPDDWLQMHRRNAFKMVVITEKTALSKIHKEISDRIADGKINVGNFEKFAEETLSPMGVWPTNPQYYEMVLRTNTLDAYNDGYRREVEDDPEMREYFPFWEYMAIDDDRVSEEHWANMTGGVKGTAYYPADVSFEKVRGPRVWNCRCTFRWVDVYEAREEGLMK